LTTFVRLDEGVRYKRSAAITGLQSGANTIAGAMTDYALAASPTAETSPPGRISAEAGRRRTFAVISHPDAGKSTLTEALALHARVITEAGAVHGKAGRRARV
jgi:peptide chain release factor 3